MHEFSLVESIVDSLLTMQQDAGWRRIVQVQLRVGVLRQVFPDILSFAFETVTRGTPLEGTKLVVEEVPLAFRCLDCGTTWGDEGGTCPCCGSIQRETLAGMELIIQSLEVEEPPS
ncbi:MAG TPA: hydrogenase maturation nickel metallochaperone HypA [Synergistaceae bacterium]|jgi:hydrogenase nickel incorporation protein HypA/HybF|nr:hydrogenase maturation nickel metallochaperone HypA [Synergistaceae bacterium]